MSKIRGKDTRPEVVVRKVLHAHGFRYRVNDRRLPGSPDIVLPKYHTVVFIHGCFWHGHNGCKKYTVPKTNTDFWTAKVTRNQERDQEVWRRLEAKGWAVIIVWECELKKKYFEETVNRVEREIKENGREHQRRKEERKLIRQLHLLERREQKMRKIQLLSELEQSGN